MQKWDRNGTHGFMHIVVGQDLWSVEWILLKDIRRYQSTILGLLYFLTDVSNVHGLTYFLDTNGGVM